ncbi:MAG: AbrB/MazE/SpoVT family DNA-binding domain-containing protein [Hyphomicrobiales bacterium]
MRVTKKGQVTIPLEIRRRAGFVPGVEVAFVMDGEEVKLVRANRSDSDVDRAEEFEAWLKRVRGTGTSGLTTDEIMEMTRGPFDDVDPGRR